MPTPFNKDLFHYFGGYLTYQDRFVARFKYRNGSKSYISFLVKHFTVEEYFNRLDNKEAPLTILQSKGYVQPHVKRMLKEAGYQPTVEGFDAYIKAQVNKVYDNRGAAA